MATKKNAAAESKAKRGPVEGKVQGEGDYDAARRYDERTEKFVADHKREIPEMAEDAEKALDSSEGDELRKAEEIGKAKAKH